MTTRPYNFGAGPAMLPESVLLDAQKELLNWQGTGMSVMEIGHRTSLIQELFQKTEQGLREVLAIPEEYQVLLVGSAARNQFSMIPLNLLGPKDYGAYLVSGLWSSMAYQECVKVSRAYCVGHSEVNDFLSLPKIESPDLLKQSSYLFFTPNETVQGIRFATLPEHRGVPLVADMTSSFLSEPINVEDYGLIFAGAQKNLSIAGLSVIIFKDSMLPKNLAVLPTMQDYQTHIKHHSLYATPPTFSCYLADKMLDWIKKQGGVQALYDLNCYKSSLLYEYIDNSGFYSNSVDKTSRSILNVCFSLPTPALEQQFIVEAEKEGLLALKGHRSAGGVRASMYNAMPIEGAKALLTFMQKFSQQQSL